MTKIRLLSITFMLVVMAITAGCVQIYSDVKINNDLSGTWTAQVLSLDPNLTQQQVENALRQAGIQDFKIKPSKGEIILDANGQNQNNIGNKAEGTGFEITTSWKDASELNKIMRAVGTGDGNAMNDNTSSQNTPLIKSDGVITVNLGRATQKVIVHFDGTVVVDSMKGKMIGDNMVEYTNGQPIYFQFRPSLFAELGGTKLILAGLVVVVLIGGYLYYRQKKRLKANAA